MDYKIEHVKHMKLTYEYMLSIFEYEGHEETKSFRAILKSTIRTLDQLLVKYKEEL